MLLPQPLSDGDQVAVVAVASPANSPEDARIATELISKANLEVRIPRRRLLWRTTENSYLAGPDWVRASEFNAALLDRTVRAIVCLRGGYGCARIIRSLDYQAAAADPKPVVGFSDITALLMALYARCKLVTYHGPVLTQFRGHTCQEGDSSIGMFVDAIMGRIPTSNLWALSESLGYRVTALRHGKASGVLIGGNLSIVCSLLGTPYMPKLEGCLLFLEEVGEPLYRIDRMLTQLDLAGVFRSVSGVVLGEFTGSEGAVARLVQGRLSRSRGPVVYGIATGHSMPNLALMNGFPYEIDTDARVFAPCRLDHRSTFSYDRP